MDVLGILNELAVLLAVLPVVLVFPAGSLDPPAAELLCSPVLGFFRGGTGVPSSVRCLELFAGFPLDFPA